MSQKEYSVFDHRKLQDIHKEIQHVYSADERPWVIGYSGGKDSTTALQLIWYALKELPKNKLTKPVYIISSNTLVESPTLIKQVKKLHQLMNNTAKKENLPFQAEHVFPEVSDTFWVNLLGRGYPAPQNTFRWCTDRMKIKPADRFILDKVDKFGEVMLILGVRKSESTTRAQVMSLHKIKGSLLSRHTRFPQTFVYTPIEDFTVDDVWSYLLQKKSPWGASNRELLQLYTDKSSGECPLVVDKTTPSCGGSRFGCWTCTVVSQDRSMRNQINNGDTWMQPLMEIRNYLFSTTDPESKKKIREFKGRQGYVRWKTGKEGEISRGPYKLSFLQDLLEKLLLAQKRIDKEAPDEEFKIILDEEIHEVRRLWITERGDWQDSVPKIYNKVMGRDLDWRDEDQGLFSTEERSILTNVCNENNISSDMIVQLLEVERQINGMTKRASAYTRIDSVLKKEWRTESEFVADYEKNKTRKKGLNVLPN